MLLFTGLIFALTFCLRFAAIAARKAKQTSLQQQGQPSPQPSIPNQVPPLSPKRKPTSQPVKPAPKKTKRDVKRQRKPSTAPTPVFDNPQPQNDVIFIDSDDEDREPSAHITSDESDIEMLSAPPPHLKTRAWSPSLPLHDSSSDEAISLDDPGLIDLPTRVPIPPKTSVGASLSNFIPVTGQNTFFLSAGDVHKLGLGSGEEAKGTLAVLEQGDRLCLLGTCTFTLLKGSIEVNGVPMRPSITSHNIFAPRSSPLPVVEFCAGDTQATVDASCLPQALHSLYKSQCSLILLQELRSNVEELGRVCRTFDGVYEPSEWQDRSISSPFQIRGLYLANKQTREIVPFILPQTWGTSLANLSPPPPSSSSANPTFLVKGPKKCGKSTFARTLLNTLLIHYKRVAYLDCDPGQSEFTPGGFVSLNVVANPAFGPPYTHPTIPYRAHFIAATTPKSSPSAYLDGVRDLVDVWKVDIMYAPISGDEDADQRVTDTIPLVVNTMGWSKGLGADLVQKIEEMVEPSHIFYFKVDNDFSYYKPAVFSSQHPDDDVTNVHVLDPAPVSVLSTSYTATDHRTLSILSYLYALFPLPPKLPSDEATCHQIMVQTWDVTLPLCAIPPYEVDIHTAFDQIILTGAGSEDVIPEELDRVLNGALVGFVQPDHKGSFKLAAGNDDNPKKAPYVQCQPPPPPSESTCIGLGLVRAVSFPTSNTDSSSSPATLHILTPVPPALLAGARVLVKGEIELPVWGMLDFREFDGADTGGVAGIEKGRVPYLQWGRVSESAIGAERRRVRRNLMRRGQA